MQKLILVFVLFAISALPVQAENILLTQGSFSSIMTAGPQPMVGYLVSAPTPAQGNGLQFWGSSSYLECPQCGPPPAAGLITTTGTMFQGPGALIYQGQNPRWFTVRFQFTDDTLTGWAEAYATPIPGVPVFSVSFYASGIRTFITQTDGTRVNHFSVTPQALPEPMSIVLLALGLLALHKRHVKFR